MADYSKKPQVLTRRGMCITLPGDRLSQEWFQYLQNVRSYLVGEWKQRPGMSLLYSTPDAGSVYFMGRVNNNQNNTFRRLIGTSNGNIYVDDVTHATLSQVDLGYSGKRYSSIISRPDRSPNPFLFLGSDNRNGKFSSTGSRTEWGLQAPTVPPEVNGAGIDYALVDDGQTFNSFTPSVGAVAAATRITGTNNFLTAIFYDVSNPGMATLAMPGAFITSGSTLQDGMLVNLKDILTGVTVYTTVVQETIQPVTPNNVSVATAIKAISYDSGNTGLCTIQLTFAPQNLRRDSVLSIQAIVGPPSAPAELVRVLSVTSGVDGIPSIRCSTTQTHIVGQLITGVLSFRAYLQGTFTIGDGVTTGTTVQHNYISWTGLAAGLQNLTRTVALNLSKADTFNGGQAAPRPVQADDLFHVSMLTDFNLINEIQIQLDIDDGSFTKNYFFISIRPPDLQGAISQTQLAVQAQQLQVQRQQLDQFITQATSTPTNLVGSTNLSSPLPIPSPESGGGGGGGSIGQRLALVDDLGDVQRESLDAWNIALGQGVVIPPGIGPVSIPADSGASQWKEFFIPVSQFQRVGNAKLGWANVGTVRITVNATAATTFGMDSLWVGGTHGPNSFNIIPYNYLYRARNTSTGSRSNASPPTRYSVNVRRRAVNITIPSYPDPQADVFDIYRIGGTLQDYQLIGTVPINNPVFVDDIPDATARRGQPIELDRFKPWVRADLPRSGTCNTVGTRVLQVSGDVFNTSWVRGTQIIVNGRLFTLYASPDSSGQLQLNESVGAFNGVAFQIPEPTFDSQPLPSVFGPYAGASGEFIFGVGDSINPGYLYWTNGNDVESSGDGNEIELCPPSEKLMNGCVLDGVVYCFSDKRSWRILPSFQGGQSQGGSDFYPQETAMGKGLIGRYALAVGDAIYYVSFDGIYRSRGDSLESLTDEALAPLFRRDGANTTFTAPVSPVDFTFPDEITLTYSFDGLYFSYRGQDANRYTFYGSFLTRGWVLDTVSGDSIIKSAREIRSLDADNVLVGTTNGNVLLRSTSQFTDNGQPVSCRLWDREEIWEDQGLRITKQVGDLIVDSNPNGATLTPTLRYENNTSSDTLSNITGSGRGQTVLDVNSGSGRIVRGAALDLTWNNGTSAFPLIYAWEPWALVKPDRSISRATDWENGGYPGSKWLQGFRLKGDSFGVNKAFNVEIDGGTFVQSFIFNSNGEQVQTFPLTTPVVCHEMRLRGTDTTVWRNYYVEWIVEPEPELAAVWETQVTSLDMPFFHHIREVMIAHLSTTDITMTVTTDGISNTYTIPNGGGVRKRSYLPLLPVKAKLDKFRFVSSAPFSLWIRDIEVRAGHWGRTDMYKTLRPFGDLSRASLYLSGGAKV